MKISAVFLAVLASLSVPTLAQAQIAPSTESNQTSAYRVSVVSRTTRAVKYEHRSGATKINFRGTDLMPAATGEAKVESKRGAMEIEVEFNGLDKPTAFGNEYLTYVMWAISPEGRSVNVGEVLVGGNHRSKLDVTTDLQTFALIVTAEPYYAVRRPSNVVILENEIRPDTVGTSEAVDAKYELIDRGGYIPTGYKFDPVVLNSKLAARILRSAQCGAHREVGGSRRERDRELRECRTMQMKHVDDLATMKHIDKKSLISASREVVQTADDAREIAREADRRRSRRCREERGGTTGGGRRCQIAASDDWSHERRSSNRRCRPPARRGRQGQRGGYSRNS